ncbi:cation/H(+) antiporter 4-like [Syzygium oleosum]|uniref:cation/H(+) antiporter 4-like n=1 Tax=Syzygium oleosum TaxID=219896 RepID=UPI0011D243AC|nr:cation/H(+) antiporter 4-like [Syzygium oleosum]
MNSTVMEEHCMTLPPKINSQGLQVKGYWEHGVLQFAMPQLQLQMVFIFAVSQACHFVLKHVGLPPFATQLLAGIMLGTTMIGKNKNMKKFLFPNFGVDDSQAQEILDAVELLGYTLFLFLSGVKTDMGMLRKVGKKSWTIGVAATLVPLMVGGAALLALADLRKPDVPEIVALTSVQSVTVFPVISCLLNDLKIQNSELGRLALSSSLVSNVLAILLLFLTSLMRLKKADAYKNFAMTAGYLLVVTLIARPAMLWMIRQTPEGRPVKESYLRAILATLLLSSLLSKYLGQSILFGSIILGLVVPDGPPLGSTIVNKLDCFFVGFLLPIYVTVTATKVDLTVLMASVEGLKVELTLVSIVFVSKFASCFVPPLLCQMPVKDSLALALILCCKGVVELGIYRYLHEMEFFSESRMGLALMAVLALASLMPILVKLLFNKSRKYAGYQKRNVVHLKPDSEVPVLACIHRADQINPVIDLVDAFYPTLEGPVRVYVLHLIKMVGRAMPIFISHELQNKVANGTSYSDHLISAFSHYARSNPGAIQASIFTAVSPPKLMYEDICHTALDNLTALILLPFHKRWSSIDGSVVSEDNHIRSLNCSVLQWAPCSVGILIDRGGSPNAAAASDEPFRVAVFFLGGNDDREALALARRMARDPQLYLTVLHLGVDEEDGCIISWDKMIDGETLKVFKEGFLGKNVEYQKEIVKDGPKTARLVRSLAHQFDLILVGRRHGLECIQTAGLSTWTELPELGILGDLLASTDLDTSCSALVVQQQQRL